MLAVSPPVAECGVSLISSIGVSFLKPSMRVGEKGEEEERRERGEEGERGGGREEEGEREGRRERGEEGERGGGREGRRERGEEGERGGGRERGREEGRSQEPGYEAISLPHLLSVLMNVAAGLITLPLRVYDS